MKGQPLIFFFRHVDLQLNNRSRTNNVQPKYIYSVVFPIIINVWSPRDITFRGIEFPDRKTNFYVYYPGKFIVNLAVRGSMQDFNEYARILDISRTK